MARTWMADFRTALVALVFFTLLCGAVYPLTITGIAQGLYPGRSDGSIVTVDGLPVGSALVGQRFSGPEYFHPRPSAAGADGYDASASSGSNLGPTSQALADRVAADVERVRSENGLAVGTKIPADAGTASASGLDPHVSPAYADLQVVRVAKARGLSAEDVRVVVRRYTNRATLWLLGEPRVNVLLLNLALDRTFGKTGGP